MKTAIILAVTALLLTAVLTGCVLEEQDADSLMPAEVAEKLCKNVELPPYETVTLDESNFAYYTFVPYREGLTAAAADALVNITPHSLVVIRAEDGSGASLAADVIKKADPNKWLCVGAETVNVAYTDHYVMLVMSEKETADALTENFKKAAEELDGMEAAVLTATNSRYEE